MIKRRRTEHSGRCAERAEYAGKSISARHFIRPDGLFYFWTSDFAQLPDHASEWKKQREKAMRPTNTGAAESLRAS